MANQYEHGMRLALEQAELAAQINEVPVGAVIIRDGALIGTGYNLRESSDDPTAHAEIIAIRAAAQKLGDWRLENTVLYVTLEPCPMCAGAIIQARIPLLVWGASDPKAGCSGSVLNLFDYKFNHKLEVVSGVLSSECSQSLTQFFKRLR